jgi:hypothetical protein
MPFTLSHPLFAAPLQKLAPRYLSVTGLVLGSMSPDFEYFIALEAYRTIGHTFAGFLLMDLPLSVAFAFAFHYVMKPVLSMLLPSWGGMDRYACERSAAWRLSGVRDWTVFLISVFIGYLSHLFMDGWSHRHTFMTEHMDFLLQVYQGNPIYKTVQYGLSLIGLGLPLLALLFSWLKWLSRLPKYEDGDRRQLLAADGGKTRLRLIMLVVAAVTVLGKAVAARNTGSLDFIFVAPFSGLLLGWFAASLLHRARSARQTAGSVLKLSALPVSIVFLMWVQQSAYALAGPYADYAGDNRMELWAWVLFVWVFTVYVITLSRTKDA